MKWVPLFVLLSVAPTWAQTYDDLMRYPQQYLGTDVSLSGQIVQVMREKDGNLYLRVQIAPGQIILVWHHPEPGHDRILEGDAVDLRGWAQGTKMYTAILGNSIELPYVIACELNAHAPGGPKFVSTSPNGCR